VQEQRDRVGVNVGQRAARPRHAIERRARPLADGVRGDAHRTRRGHCLVVGAFADQHQRRAHLRQLRLDLPPPQLRVDRQRDRRRAYDREERDDGRRRVLHDHGDGIARAHAEAVELFGERLGDLSQFGVGERPARVAVDQRGERRVTHERGDRGSCAHGAKLSAWIHDW
jgi:hypothetical protein